ncbi:MULTISPECIES: hypothetical protein [unclassified Microcoleus]|uniref:hypothetical protein n=1 Tax=unclassified Microcoleus TaxID=2642155 RepID=UPI002FD38B4A
MSENDESKQFLPDHKLDTDRIVVEVPADQKSPYQERIPSGYEPMGEIYLRGRAFRGLAGGRIPWWVLISGWIFFGGLALLIMISAIASASFPALPGLIIVAIPLIILWRGTTAKFSIKKHKSRRR